MMENKQGETTRQKKFAREIQREISELLQHGLEGMPKALITVTQVRTTADLQIARIYLTTFPDAAIAQVLAVLEADAVKVRYALSRKIKHQVRSIPELVFYADDTRATTDRLEQIFAKIKVDDESRSPLEAPEAATPDA
jgi:ribosome-binding factor A